VVPVIANKVATDEVVTILNKVDAALTTTDLITLNKSADIDKQDPEAVADKWVKDHGFRVIPTAGGPLLVAVGRR